jgi:hypothetical protein
MAVPANLYDTYDALGQKEDVSDLIHNISPTETPFLTMIGTTTARGRFHEWQLDTLDAPAANLHDEGADWDDADTSPVATAVRGNYTQISAKFFNVTGTLEVVEKYGRDSEIAYQAAKAARALKTDVDFNMTGINQASLATSPRQSGSLETWLETNVYETGSGGGWSSGVTVVRTDGTPAGLTQAKLDSVIQSAWSNGGKPSVILCGPTQKTTISTMDGVGVLGSSGVTRTDRAARTIFATADLYVSNFGELRIVPSRHIRTNGTDDQNIFIVDPEYAKIAYLRPWQQFDLAKTGDAIRREMLVEWTLEVCNEKAHGIIADLA